ncbi:MAG TPA: hypothetical protein VFY36_08545 [Solirubrobacteraceae bacterium]|nr:hypothetical protein [Solirubrobacteraceae bacterium]
MRMMGIALVALFTISAVIAVAAQGTEGPFWKVNGSRLAAGQVALILASAKKTFTLQNPVSKVKIECSAFNLSEHSTINGSSGANAGTSKEVIEYSGCTGGAKEEGENCKPQSGKITTTLVTNTLGYSRDTKIGSLVLVLFKPSVGSTFTTITFEGTNCFAASTAVTGSTIGEATVNGKFIHVGSEPAEELSGQVRFIKGNKSILVENGGTLTNFKSGLTAFGTAASLEGEALIDLSNGNKWGVFTA